jgi:hypothetical protein
VPGPGADTAAAADRTGAGATGFFWAALTREAAGGTRGCGTDAGAGTVAAAAAPPGAADAKLTPVDPIRDVGGAAAAVGGRAGGRTLVFLAAAAPAAGAGAAAAAFCVAGFCNWILSDSFNYAS